MGVECNNECIICDVCKLLMKNHRHVAVSSATFDFTQDDYLMLGQLSVIESQSN